MFENRALRRTFESKRDGAKTECRKLHSDVFKSRMRWVGHVAHMGKRGGVCWVLVGKAQVRRQLGNSIPRWEDNIKNDLQEV